MKSLVAYETDASMIEGKAVEVIFPKTIDEIRKIVTSCHNIVIRGGGSGLVGGAVPLNSLVLDLSKMNKILKLEAAKGIVEVEPGILLDELNQELAKYGLEFPVNPSSHSICTIGGMIATNAVGSRAIKYGRTSNWVESLKVVDGHGQLLEVKKSDLTDFSGMEGITGIIVNAKLKLTKKKARTATILKANEIEKIIETVKKLKLSNEVSMIEFFDKQTSLLMGLEEEYHLITEFESDAGNLKGQEYEKIMKLRDSAYPRLAAEGYVIIQDPKIFLEKVPEFLSYLEKNKIPVFGHLGSGILHPCFKKNQNYEETILLTKKLHGSVTGEHGYGLAKKQFIEDSDKKIILRVKKRYDPFSKLNPNKVIDTKIKAEPKVEQEAKEESLERFEQEKNEEVKVEETRKIAEEKRVEEEKPAENEIIEKKIEKATEEEEVESGENSIEIAQEMIIENLVESTSQETKDPVEIKEVEQEAQEASAEELIEKEAESREKKNE